VARGGGAGSARASQLRGRGFDRRQLPPGGQPQAGPHRRYSCGAERFCPGGYPANVMELWWIGQSGFRLRDPASGPTVFCDPYLTVDDDRTWQAPIDPEGLAQQADLVLVSHEHIDHLDRPALQAAAHASGSRFSLVLPRPLVSEAEALGIPRERILG